MTKKLNWRLGKLPSADEVRELVKDKIITQEEAREILFNSVDEEKEREVESYKQEIKFLREVVNKLSNRSTIVETIREIIPPGRAAGYSWEKPYEVWCSSNPASTITYSTSTSALQGTGATNSVQMAAIGGSVYLSDDNTFLDIKTF